MNKKCPWCKKRLTKHDDHLFWKGQRYHTECVGIAWLDEKRKRRRAA